MPIDGQYVDRPYCRKCRKYLWYGRGSPNPEGDPRLDTYGPCQHCGHRDKRPFQMFWNSQVGYWRCHVTTVPRFLWFKREVVSWEWVPKDQDAAR